MSRLMLWVITLALFAATFAYEKLAQEPNLSPPASQHLTDGPTLNG